VGKGQTDLGRLCCGVIKVQCIVTLVNFLLCCWFLVMLHVLLILGR